MINGLILFSVALIALVVSTAYLLISIDYCDKNQKAYKDFENFYKKLLNFCKE